MGLKFKETLKTYIKAQVSLFHTETSELKELREDVETVCKEMNRSLFFYTPEGEGQLVCKFYYMRKTTDTNIIQENFNRQERNKTCPIEEFLSRVLHEPEENDVSRTSIPSNSVIIVSGVTRQLDTDSFIQTLIEGSECNRFLNTQTVVIFTDTILSLPDKLIPYSTELAYELPNYEELYGKVSDELIKLQMDIEKLCKKKNKKIDKSKWFFNNQLFPQIANAMQGMTTLEAITALRLCIIQHSADEDITNVLRLISEQKTSAIQKSNSLKFIPYEEQPDRDDIGGFDRLLNFVSIRAKAFTDTAREQNIDIPKGVVLLGLPGTGKSMVAKATGKLLGLPVVVLDIGSTFNSYVGISESRIKQELAKIDAINGCVLLIDEADKAFAGNNSPIQEDGGVASRVFGIILSWFQEHRSKTFVVITLNNVDSLPPEIFRAGRFDKVFFAGLPQAKDRRKILEAHFRKRGVKLHIDEWDWEEIVLKTQNFVGAELEAIVVDSRYISFNNRNDGTPTADEILSAIEDREPLYEFQKAKLDKLMEEYKQHATPIGY